MRYQDATDIWLAVLIVTLVAFFVLGRLLT